MIRILILAATTAVIAVAFNNCSKVNFSQGSLSAGVSKANGTDTVSGTDPGAPAASPSESPQPGMPDICVSDKDDDDMANVGDHEDGDDGMPSGGFSMLQPRSLDQMSASQSKCSSGEDGGIEGDDDSCESDDGGHGHRLGLCLFTGQGDKLSVAADAVVVQYISQKSSSDVCISRNACDNLINAYLNKTSGVIGGPVTSHDGGLVKYVNLSHVGLCQKNNPNVKSISDAQISAEIAKLLAK
jgi:hypothetical protein